MKKRTKGILAFAFLGGIMVTSGVVIAIPGIAPDSGSMEFTETGTPADNFPDEQRAQFCGDGVAHHNKYVTEYSIPTVCTQPLAITSDFFGNIWFMQTNTGNVAKFDPNTKTFSEFENPSWPPGARSMVWGMDYSSDNSIWYSDEAHDSVWRFSIDDEQYQRLAFPSGGNSLPQRLVVDGSQIVVNDFTGNKLTILDASGYDEDTPYFSIPSPVDDSVTAGFVQDSESNIWYTNWIPNGGGVLVKFAQDTYMQESVQGTQSVDLLNHVDIFKLPPQVIAINGIVIDNFNNIWMVDTATSNFYNFDIIDESFTQYVTSPVPETAYGNHTGLIKSTPLSRPYWTGLGSDGQIIFNEQTANRIGVLDPQTLRLVEYSIPTKNPTWADCGLELDCGIAQAFDFTVVGDKIWFTEWATNNIGVVDTSIAPTIDVSVDTEKVFYEDGSSVTLQITANDDAHLEIISNSVSSGLISIESNTSELSLSAGDVVDIPFQVSVSESLLPGTYQVLVGAQTSDIAVSQFFTLVIG